MRTPGTPREWPRAPLPDPDKGGPPDPEEVATLLRLRLPSGDSVPRWRAPSQKCHCPSGLSCPDPTTGCLGALVPRGHRPRGGATGGPSGHWESLLPFCSWRIVTKSSRACIFSSCSDKTGRRGRGWGAGLVVPRAQGSPFQREDRECVPLWGTRELKAPAPLWHNHCSCTSDDP